MNTSIVIISYNTRELTLACLRSVFAQTAEVGFEVIVVDNASTDGSAEAIAVEFPGVRLIQSTENLGFARANNLAAEGAKGEFLLLLNPDTVVLDRAIERLVKFAQHRPDAGVYGGRTLNADGTLNPTSCWGRSTPWSEFCRGVGLNALFRGSRIFNPETMPNWKRDSVREVDIVTGCFLLIRRELWAKLGGFDPAFFMYGEDADLCLRARKHGARCVICPEAAIIHYTGASERVRADKMVRLLTAKRQLFERHWRPGTAWFGVMNLRLWAASRFLAYWIASRASPRLVESCRTWSTVWSRRLEWGRLGGVHGRSIGKGRNAPFRANRSIGRALMVFEFAVGAGVACGYIGQPQWFKRRQIEKLRRQCRDTRTLVLTYDDGPSEGLTPQVLDMLAAHGAKASFFVLGMHVRGRESTIKQIVDGGHELGCHSFRHLHAWKTLPWNATRDIGKGYLALENWIAGNGIFRPPYGKLTLATSLAVRRRGAPIAWWTVDSGDTQPNLPAPKQIAEAVSAAGGGVVLMHDFDRSRERGDFVLATTQLLLETATREGFRVCRYGELFREPVLRNGGSKDAVSTAEHGRYDLDHHSSPQ